ncbi:hypothetical protein B0H10DRAFT_1814098 [Mycena sp. CBHHK59/15]|nr:hypothetical protein B0H10DRAFT_1814098 [Mycena sp. CBHHK59/15]
MRRGLENQLARSQAEVVKLEERCRMLENSLRATRDMLRARDIELERMRNAGSTGQTEDTGQSRQAKAGGSSNVSSAIATRTLQMEEHRAQLRSAEIFMTQTDSWSGAQVVQSLHDLNSEIIQFAASATELCTFDSGSSDSSKAMQDTSARLGPNLASLLSARDHSQDPTFVSLALQAGISTCIARAMASFCLGLPSKSDVTLCQVYSHIFVAEPQPTSARWRALTHRHVHTLYPDLTQYAADELRETICRWTSDILVAARATHESTSRAWVRQTFGEQVGRMVKSVAGIARICKEEIMSTNFDILMVEASQNYDERTMMDAFDGVYESSQARSQGTVLATTELGLRRMTRRSAPDKVEERTIEQQLLIKPKVILDSVGTTLLAS